MVPHEYQYLVDERDTAVDERDDAVTKCNALEADLADANRKLAWFNRQVFGQKSERCVDLDPKQGELDLGLDEGEAKTEEMTVPAHKRRKKRRSTGEDAISWPEDLPVEEEILDVPEAERIDPLTGETMEVIGEDVVDKLARRPGACFIKRTRRLKRANPKNPKAGVVQAPARSSLLLGGKLDESFLAWICTEKFGFHQPLYRIGEKLKLEGVEISRQTLSRTVMLAAEKIVPLFEEMKRRTLASDCLHVDETPLKMQQKKKCKQCYVWLYLAADANAPPYHVYDFCDDRSQRHPRGFLKNFDGTIHADAWSGYVAMDKEGLLTWSACWAHARRKFENASDGDPKLRAFVMRRIKLLFMLERRAWSRSTPELRLKTRTILEKPLVEDLFQHVLDARKNLLPRSSLAGACDYLLSYRKNFECYLEDPNLRMDNNPAERGLRKLVLGRKNWIFVGSPKAGRTMAAMLSLVQTCRAMGINPIEYLDDVFRRILDHNSQALYELLPDQWAAARNLPSS
jgi:transposase